MVKAIKQRFLEIVWKSTDYFLCLSSLKFYTVATAML